MPTEDRYSIGIIASPRQNSLAYKTKDGNASGEGTKITQRGLYQFTGHTAVYARKNCKLFARGLVPDGDVVSAVVAGQTVQGKWQDDNALFYDPTSIVLDIAVDKATALAFRKYHQDHVETPLKAYTLRPEKHDQTNCVGSAITVFVNFMAEYSEQIKATDLEKSKYINGIVDKLLKMTSEHSMTMQGHLMQTINAINSDRPKDASNERLVAEMKDYLATEIKRLEGRTPTIALSEKIAQGKKILSQLEHKSSLDDKALNSVVKNINAFAGTNTSRLSRMVNWQAVSMKRWQVIVKCYHLAPAFQSQKQFKSRLSKLKKPAVKTPRLKADLPQEGKLPQRRR
ncbi:MAG: hypothetical protein NXI01_02020 [Gammaproteobacteria bacterium]|nr:hypothetical protein [Gammaproteobacteria bacterium]